MSQDSSRSDVGELSLDACLELLSSRQRRAILGFFLEGETDHASIDEVVSEIIDVEVSATGQRPGHDAVASTLFHVHLPRLADTGVLEYDPHHLDIRYHGDARIEDIYEKVRDLE